MPGLSVNDFGDSIRFGASTGAEDEPDLTKISCDLDLFEAYTKGFIEGCAGALTEEELNQLVNGAKMMTLECGEALIVSVRSMISPCLAQSFVFIP